jgi:SAM-dependent methyltransferase
MTRLDKVIEISRQFTPRKNLLDIGCGDGKFTRQLAMSLYAESSIGIDKKNGQDIKDYLPTGKTSSFDFIFAGNMIDIVPDPDFLLKEIHRLLTLDGIALLTFPTLDWWANKIAILLGFQPYGDRPSTEFNVGKLFIQPDRFSEKNPGIFHYFSRRAFKQLANINGFKVKFYSLPLQRFSICRLSLR